VTRFDGILRSLFRERHPFAVLAVLATLLPSVLAPVGVFGSGLRLADGTLVICTGDGFERIADADRAGDHEPGDCCKSGCIHAFGRAVVGPAPVAVPVRYLVATGVSWPIPARTVTTVLVRTSQSIRAPPVESA
jgi:Protein of unknown function (DUF2946)